MSKRKYRKAEISPPKPKEGMLVQPMYGRDGKFHGWTYITINEWARMLRMK